MSGVLDSVRDCAQNHPMSVAAGLMVALPGTYFFLTGKSIACAIGLQHCNTAASPSSSSFASSTDGLSVYSTQNPLDVQLNFPTSKWTDKPASAHIIQRFHSTTESFVFLLSSAGERLGLTSTTTNIHDFLELLENRWVAQYPWMRLVAVAISTALPGAFLVFARASPESWTARHRVGFTNALRVFALAAAVRQGVDVCVQDLLVAVVVVVGFEVCFRSLNSGLREALEGAPPTINTESVEATPVFETLLSQTHAIVSHSAIGKVEEPPEPRASEGQGSHKDGCSSTKSASSKDADVARLQESLTAAKTSKKVKELELNRVRKELQDVRETLNDTFFEYSSLRNEMKTMKQTLGRDHQAVIYRKDIELFALRKGNEQKENYIKERESKLEDIYRQQKATLELKDAQVRNLKDRIAFLERQQSPRLNGDSKVDSAVDNDTQDAVQVRLLRVKGRSSTEIEQTIEEKDTEIATLKIDLAKAMSACEALSKTQEELRRSWDSVFEVQNMLNEERRRHVQTQNKLQEAATRLEEESKSWGMKSSPTPLPTIEEQDKHELEAMFNAAQEDNLRLYTQVEALEKRVREANARVFTSEQEAEALTEQLRLEKAINEDMETARPSLVHRVHFQRMEGQLKESRDQLAEKEDEIEQLKNSLAEKNEKFTQLEKENETMAKAIADLEATKQQLMLDHERLAQHRARQRNSSAEHTSARSSATLFTDAQNQPITSDEPLPARPISLTRTHTPSNSIQGTPERHVRNDTQRPSMISNDVPPPELRGVRRKSLTLKGFMKKFVRKDDNVEEKGKKEDKIEKEDRKEKERPKTALMPKDKNILMRPKTAAPTTSPTPTPALPTGKPQVKDDAKKEGKGYAKGKEDERFDTPASKPNMTMTNTPRYYATHADGRPMTAAPTTGEAKSNAAKGNAKESSGRPMTAAPSAMATNSGPTASAAKAKEEADVGKARQKSRGWAASRKLVRRSIA